MKSREIVLLEIKRVCQEKVAELFQKGIPDEVQTRYEKEIQYLEKSKYFDEFEKVYIESQINKGMMCSKGTISGSFLYFLMTEKGYNPLKPYYYCKMCGYYEPVEKYQNCIDASDKCCPECGNKIKASGYNVAIESVWGLDGKKAIGFEREDIIHPVVEKRLKQLVAEFKPRTFEDKIKLCACASNGYSWEATGDEELDLAKFKEIFEKCEFLTREELYDKLCAKGIKPLDAYKASEFVRKGGVAKRQRETKKYEITEAVLGLAHHFVYLESRAHAIQTAYQYWIKNSH